MNVELVRRVYELEARLRRAHSRSSYQKRRADLWRLRWETAAAELRKLRAAR